MGEMGSAPSPKWTRADTWRSGHPASTHWTAEPKGQPFMPGAPSMAMGTVKDLIKVHSKGDIGAPYAERPNKPIAGFDRADDGGAYRSYHSMFAHRLKHVRTMNGPNERFDFNRGPPATSWDHGFGKQKLRPPHYPCSQSEITKAQESIIQSTGGRKGI